MFVFLKLTFKNGKIHLNEDDDEKLCTHIFYCPHVQCFTKNRIYTGPNVHRISNDIQ